MPQRTSMLRGYRGSAILVASAVTLIAALAIPRASQIQQSPRPAPVDVSSKWTAEVKRSEVQVGNYVAVGDPLMVLTDSALEAEIAKLESEFKLAMLGTKEAVAEPGMLGMIGSMPRVTWTLPRGEIASPQTSTPQVAPQTATNQASPLQKDLDAAIARESKASDDIDAKEVELQEVVASVTQAETELSDIQTSDEASTKETAKLQRLYDMGAIPKRRLDAAISVSDQTTKDLVDAKARLEAAKTHQADLEKELADLRAMMAKLKSQLDELRSKLNADKAKISPAPTAPPKSEAPTQPKPVRRLVYGTSTESNAPVQVKLLDAEEPGEEQKIDTLHKKLLELKAKREELKIKATQAGRVTWIATPGTKLIPGAKIVTIEPLK
jgi:hypothetical protein